MAKVGNGGKGIAWNTQDEVRQIGELNGFNIAEGVTKGMPKIETDIDACEVVLLLAPETNGHVAVKAWQALGKQTGIDHTHLAIHREDEKIRFRDIQAQPRKIISSPTWSGIESETVSYNAGYTNVHELIPWRTLTGRQQFYQDHPWMRAFGEGCVSYRPPVDLKTTAGIHGIKSNGNPEILLNFITPHQKWGIHSTYTDNLLMLTLSRGGPCVWLSEDDAKRAGIVDNDWIELFNINGAIAARAVVSQRVNPGMVMMYHAQEKIVNTPGSEILGGEFSKRSADRNFDDIQKDIYGQFENTFMMYLPRLCEHCLNPACVASCPSGSIYKREEDGIVLIDQDKCRGWRMCISGCPYKKIYYNWKSGKAEKCIFCYPRIEAGQPTVCSETCVGRIRYLGVLLYDADRIQEAASVEHDRDLYHAQLDIFLDPNDPQVIAQAAKDGIPDKWMEAARNSPVYKMAVEWKVALPLHPEYRTLPMVWYVPPLSPISAAANAGHVGSNGQIPDVNQLRIPVKYLANLLTAGDTVPVVRALERMLAMRAYQREKHVDQRINTEVLQQVGITQEMVEEMYHIMAIANYEDRFVIPSTHREYAENTFNLRGGCGFSFGNGCSEGTGNTSLFGSEKKRTIPIKLEV